MKQAIRKSNIKNTKTAHGKIPNSFGFHSGGGGFIRNYDSKVIEEQRSNGVAPLRVVGGKIINL